MEDEQVLQRTDEERLLPYLYFILLSEEEKTQEDKLQVGGY